MVCGQVDKHLAVLERPELAGPERTRVVWCCGGRHGESVKIIIIIIIIMYIYHALINALIINII